MAEKSSEGKVFLKLKGEKISGRIENWYIQWTEKDNYDLPFMIWGTYRYDSDEADYQKFAQGSRFHTSQVTELNEVDGYVKTANSVYYLGERRAPPTEAEIIEAKKRDEELAQFFAKNGNPFF